MRVHIIRAGRVDERDPQDALVHCAAPHFAGTRVRVNRAHVTGVRVARVEVTRVAVSRDGAGRRHGHIHLTGGGG